MKQIFAWLFAAIFFAAGCAQSPDLAEPVRGGGYENADGLVIVAACPPATRTDIEEGKSGGQIDLGGGRPHHGRLRRRGL